LAACGAICTVLVCFAALGYFAHFFVCGDIKGPFWFWTLLAYPAYAFRKWSRVAWQAGAGTRKDWAIAVVIVAASIVLVVALLEYARDRDVARVLGFAFLVAYSCVTWTFDRGDETAPASPIENDT